MPAIRKTQTVAVSQTPKTGRQQTRRLSLPSSSTMILNALERLCSMKNQAQFTPHQAETWAAVLSTYPTEDVNLAVLQIGLSIDPFPDLSKLVLCCDQIRRERAGTIAQGKPAISRNTIAAIAQRLQMPVERTAPQ